MITIRADENQIARAELLLKTIPDGVSRAIVAALNRAAEAARTDAVRKVRERYYVRAGTIRDEIRITKATLEDQRAVISAAGSPISLSKFWISPARPLTRRRRKPVIARVVRGEGGPIKGAFVAQMKSGHIGVFHRAGRARLPIVERYGPSVPQMLGHPDVIAYVEERAQGRLAERMDHEIARLLRGVGK